MQTEKFRLALLILILLVFAGTAASWWDQDWSYRKPINVTERSSENLNNYQVRIQLDTASMIENDRLQDDCSDIRFTEDDGRELDYWMEDGCDTGATTFWVEIPSIASDSREDIYVYYDNLEAISESSGFSTFPMFDNFERGSIGSNWTKYGDTGYWSINDGRLRADDTNGEQYSYLANTQHEFSNESGFAIGSEIYFSGSAEWGGFLLWSNLDEHHHIDFNPTRYQDRTEASHDYEQPPDPPVNQGEWYDVKIAYNDSDGTLYWFNNDRFAYKESDTGINTPTSGYTGVISNYYHDYVLWEYVYTRRLTSPEPSVKIGNQQRASICDRKGPKNECIVDTQNDISRRTFEVEDVFISERSARLESESEMATLSVFNESILSGVWTGNIGFKAREISIKPGAKFHPENRIILNETG